jgi:DNA anti-recombination protein RmuC
MSEPHQLEFNQFYSGRQDRLESAIERLTQISSELKSMLAVHEERINQQERSSDDLHNVVEQRRQEMESKFNTVYDVMDRQDNAIIDRLEEIKRKSDEAHEKLGDKIDGLQRFMWMAVGGGITVTWIISSVLNYFRFWSH